MTRGREYEAAFSFDAAAQQYELAYSHARSTPEKLESQVALADVLVRYSREGFVEPGRVQTIRDSRRRAILIYQEALRRLKEEGIADPQMNRLEVRVVNNLSTVLILEGQAKTALRRLEESREKVDAVDLPRYLYNLANAHEQSNSYQKALDLYLEAGFPENGYLPSLEQATELVLDELNLMEYRGVELLNGLIERGEYRLVEEFLEEALDEEDCDEPLHEQEDQSICKRLALPFIKYLMATEVDSAGFERRWASELSEDGRLGTISMAFDGSLATILSPDTGSLFSHWTDSPQDLKVFAAFLKYVGDLYFRQRQNREALERYSLAWSLDPENHDAAIYLLNLLSIAPKELDPEAQLLWQVLARGPEQSDDHRRGEFFFMVGNAFDSRYHLGEDGASMAAVASWRAARNRLADSTESADLLTSVEARLASVGQEEVAAVDDVIEDLTRTGRLEEALQRSAAQRINFRSDIPTWGVDRSEGLLPWFHTPGVESLANPQRSAEYQEFVADLQDHLPAGG